MKQVSITVPTKPQTPLVPPGVHPFVLQAIYGIGTQPGTNGNKPKNTVILMFELPDQPPLEFTEDDGSVTRKPRVVSKWYNLSFNENADLRKHLEGLRGRPFTEQELGAFNLDKALGATGNLSVVHKKKMDGTMRAEVAGLFCKNAGQNIKGTLAKEVFSVLALENAAELKTCGIPEWVTKFVEKSDEYIALLSAPTPQPQQQVSDNDGGPLDDVAF